MTHKQSILKFFPNASASRSCDGYIAAVRDPDGSLLVAEWGDTAKEAWRNAFLRIYMIWKPLLSVTGKTNLLTDADPGDSNGVQQGTVERGKA